MAEHFKRAAITVLFKNSETEKMTVDIQEKMIMNYLPVNMQRKEKSKRLITYPSVIALDLKKQTALYWAKYSPVAFVIGKIKRVIFSIHIPYPCLSKQFHESRSICNALHQQAVIRGCVLIFMQLFYPEKQSPFVSRVIFYTRTPGHSIVI